MEKSHLQNPSSLGDGQDQPAGADPIGPRKPGVLVVDDEVLIRSMLDLALRQRGCVVWLAANGGEAIELYRQHFRDVDLVLLDVRMPGLDGPQTLAALEAIDAKVCCCYMSGYTGRYTLPDLLTPSVLRVLTKPFRLDEVDAVLAERLGNKNFDKA